MASVNKPFYYLYQMKYVSFLVVVILLTSSCNKAGKQLKERIINADSIAINYFKGDGTMDTVVAVKIVRDRKTLDELTAFITAKGKSEIGKCGYDGSIHVFKMNRVVQDIDFSLAAEGGCNQFTFSLTDKKDATTVSEAAKELLLQLKKK